MDEGLAHHANYIGLHVSALPTPSLIISQSTVLQNIDELHRNVEQMGIGFRPHIKTLKTLEMTRLMLGNGRAKGVICSTIPEIVGCLPLAKTGELEEAVYGLPIAPSKLPRLAAIRSSLRIILIVDHDQQLEALEDFERMTTPPSDPWPVFIKIDVGSRRAGVPAQSPRLEALVARAKRSHAVRVIGFYCHAGHSYGGRSTEAAEEALKQELDGLLHATSLMKPDEQVLLSLGSTPTAHVITKLRASLPSNVKLELHAGNFPCNDLQQVSTGLVGPHQQALRVLAEVCSVYPERNEALINAGAIALSKEMSAFDGFGNLISKGGWHVARMSQEHGILSCKSPTAPAADVLDQDSVERQFKVGDLVQLHVAHSCITAASFFVYYVVDDEDVIVSAWVPWKGW
ncbi:hypothetical protein ACHAQA_006601 [Verticillium albo-atrum]